jgi:hypothetical protein
MTQEELTLLYEELKAENVRIKNALKLTVNALRLAVNILGEFEPGDSRAVSNDFVALAAISCGLGNEECGAIVNRALEIAPLLHQLTRFVPEVEVTQN